MLRALNRLIAYAIGGAVFLIGLTAMGCSYVVTP